jgi:hypothetical protein
MKTKLTQYPNAVQLNYGKRELSVIKEDNGNIVIEIIRPKQKDDEKAITCINSVIKNQMVTKLFISEESLMILGVAIGTYFKQQKNVEIVAD